MLIQPAARGADSGQDAAAAARERAILMCRYVVSATRIERNPWRYASLPGFEVLSRAPDEETNWELSALQRGQMFQGVVIPSDWYPRPPVPYTVIIDDTSLDDVPAAQLHSRPIVFRAPVDALAWGELSEDAFVSTDLAEVHDHDTYAINANVYGVSTQSRACASSGLQRLLDCAPPLPRWLTAGMTGPKHGILRDGFALVDTGRRDDRFSTASNISGMSGMGLGSGDHAYLVQQTQRAMGAGTLWGSQDETERLLAQLRADKRRKIEILPLGQLFDEAGPTQENRTLWESEAGLFARWGLMGPGHDDPAMSRAFPEFVRRARREPVTEQLFTECFGFGYSVMERRLEKYLKSVLEKPTSVETAMPLKFPGIGLEEATADQAGRILGDWLRMQANAHWSNPELRGEFLDAAGRMLERAYRDDIARQAEAAPSLDAEPGPGAEPGTFFLTADRIRDPRLLAVYGLYEHDAGNDPKARELLEAAVKAGVARPKAYLVLSELRFAEAAAAPAGPKGTFSAGQGTSILGPLRAALRYAPTVEVYSRIAEVWSRCDATPDDRDIELLAEGVSFFPRDTNLSYASALVCARAGHFVQATRLIDNGLAFATDDGDRDRFNQLLSSMAVPSRRGAK